MQHLLEKINKFFLMVGLGLSLNIMTSCDRNFLETKPMDRFSEEAVWEDPALINTFINQVYRSIPSGLRYSFYNLSIISDELNGRNNVWAWGVLAGNLTPDNLSHANLWSINVTPNRSYWKTINYTNQFFLNIDRPRSSAFDDNLKNRMIGEMKAIRAFSYLNLISLYGGVPLITKPFTLNDDFNVKRNSYAEVMSFILSEIEEAIALLPATYSAAEQGRLTKGAAMAIKSRAALYRASPLNNPENDPEKWKFAADAAKAVIDLGIYNLFQDYRTMFLEENAYNSEMIWQRPYNQLQNAEAVYVELSLYPNGYNGFAQIHPVQNLVDDYETTNGLLPKSDPTYDPQQPYVNRDPRFYASILYDGAKFQHREVETFLPGGLDSNEGPVSGWNASETGYYQLKYANEKIVNPSSLNMSRTPWTWFRYAEILLNYAEANYFLGNEDVARQYLNMVRKRPSVNMPDVKESGDALFTRLVNERRIELVFEEHRWFDVRRLKIAPEVMSEDITRMKITKQADGKKFYEVLFWKEANFNPERDYLLPIPQDEIDKNALLEQNPGY